MSKTFFFYGYTDEEDNDPMWKVLHDHFEKLASKDDAGSEEVVFKGKGAKRK